jgi:hypothetical protein
MAVKIGLRFWAELSAGTASLIVVAVTSLWPQWIEAVFGFAPDADSGETEWGLAVGLCILAAVMFIAARLEWRRFTGAARTAV